jgi:hypothetical protein
MSITSMTNTTTDKRCGSCGAPLPEDFKEEQGQPLPCGH